MLSSWIILLNYWEEIKEHFWSNYFLRCVRNNSYKRIALEPKHPGSEIHKICEILVSYQESQLLRHKGRPQTKWSDEIYP